MAETKRKYLTQAERDKLHAVRQVIIDRAEGQSHTPTGDRRRIDDHDLLLALIDELGELGVIRPKTVTPPPTE